MRTDIDDITDEDEGSLFGSPPPSPQRGGSPLPALALPSGPWSTVITQNVGAIALPGSHCNSEHSVNPLASVLSYDTPQGIVSQPLPPVHQQPTADNSSCHRSRTFSPAPSTPSVSSSRCSSQGPSTQLMRKKGSRNQTHEPASRPPPIDIPLPDPSAPPPANWLRSQSALLGHAGLVGGIKTSTLSNRHTRGLTPSNPIIIADDDDTPARSKSKRSPLTRNTSIDYSELPKPTTQDIVQILIKQKEIFPVLQDVLKLIAKGPLAKNSTLTESRSDPSTSSGPPLKKRKLSRVPAGACDWDVPYPFQQGEGPQEYQSTWERDRGKQLIAQLVSLIKAASRKAALRIHLQKEQFLRSQLEAQRNQTQLLAYALKELEHSMPKVGGHYRPQVASYPMSDLPAQSEPDNGHSGKFSASTDPANTAEACLPSTSGSTSLDDLLSSLLTATQAEGNKKDISSDLNSLFAPSNSHEPTPELDPGLLDSWMSIFQTFPNSTDSLSTDDSLMSSLASTNSQEVLPAADFPLDLGSWSMSSILDAASYHIPSNSGASESQALLAPTIPLSTESGSVHDGGHSGSLASLLPSEAEHSQSLDLSGLTVPSDSLIDPELLAISMPPIASAIAEPLPPNSGTPSLIASPMPSMSSFGDFDPLTPISPAGEWDLAEVAVPPGQDSTGDGSLPMTSGTGFSGATMPEILMDNGFQGGELADMSSKEKGKEKEACVALSSVLPALVPSIEANVVSLGASSSVFTPPPPRPFLPSDKTSDKAELLRRAKARRKQLAEEIIKARTQLWETTIEHDAKGHSSFRLRAANARTILEDVLMSP